MERILYSIFIILFFTGCVYRTKYVYIEPSCPKIETMKLIPNIDFNVTDGCVCDQSLTNMVNGIKALRNVETTYYNDIELYNKTFVKKSGVTITEEVK